MISNEYDGTKNGLLYVSGKLSTYPSPISQHFWQPVTHSDGLVVPPIASNKSLPVRKPNHVQPAVHVVDRGSDVWPEVDVLHSWEAILPKCLGKSSLYT